MFESAQREPFFQSRFFYFFVFFPVNNLFTETSITLKNVVLMNSRAEMKNKRSYEENNVSRVTQNFVRRFISATFFLHVFRTESI